MISERLGAFSPLWHHVLRDSGKECVIVSKVSSLATVAIVLAILIFLTRILFTAKAATIVGLLALALFVAVILRSKS